ncbi:MAG TPA: ABC transporter permease [Vicinamibacterales bacterium]|nr:ABC transporter permease [Vicinamibacterales bacterium]
MAPKDRLVRFLLRRGAAALILVFAVTSGALLLAQLAPGDFASQIGRTPAEIAAERARLGLDRPFLERYAEWLRRSATLDLGESFQYQRPVTELVGAAARNTALLASCALVLATLLGIPWGVITGTQRGLAAAALRAMSLLLLSVPPLISSLVLLTVAARTGWLPVSGMGTVRHLIVPTLALALPIAALLERFQSSAMADSMSRPSTSAARARGVPEARVIWRHGWRQSLAPVLGIYGVVVGSLFSGSFAVESVTSWPGLGALMLQALMSRDMYLVAGCAAAGSAFLAAGILAADVVHAVADPRVTLEDAR